MRLIYCFVLFANALQTLSLDLSLITTISITNDLKIQYDPNFAERLNIRSRKDGVFIFQRDVDTEQAVIVLTNGNFIVRKYLSYGSTVDTNILQSFVENNQLNIIQRERTISVLTRNRPDIVFKTISNDYFIDFTDIRTNINISEFKISSSSKILITNYSESYRTGYLSKISLNGKPGKHIVFRNSDVYSVQGSYWHLGDYRDLEQDNKTIISCIQNNDKLSFYRITDSDLLSPQNRFTLGSSQNGSLTATVNNPEQVLLNIQSSTNFIDWNTFKTIKNEPTFEIVVPANKPKEFIRVIE